MSALIRIHKKETIQATLGLINIDKGIFWDSFSFLEENKISEKSKKTSINKSLALKKMIDSNIVH